MCGSDVHIWDGSVGAILDIPLPTVVGHEFVGRVVAIGEGAEADSIGQPLVIDDRIVFTHESCDQCMACRVLGQPSLCDNRRHYMMSSVEEYPYLVGGLSEYIYVFPRSGRFKVPDEIPSTWASGASCALRTVMQAYERLGQVDPWHRVVVQGSGPVGLFACAVAKARGAGQIVVVGDPAERLDVARAWGADETVSVGGTSPDDRVAAVVDLTEGGADVVFEGSGGRGVFNEGLGMLRRGGRYLVVGQVGDNVEEVRPSQITAKQATILGSFSGHTSAYWQALQFLSLKRDVIDFDLMFTNTYALSDATTALENMRSFLDIKAVIDPTA